MKVATAVALLAGFTGGGWTCDRNGGRPKSANVHVGAAPRHAGAPAPVAPVDASALCVTKGTVEPRGSTITVDDAAVRAVAAGTGGDVGELRFTVRGATEDTSRLASGRTVQQLGLKLRAKDGCNVVYVMWKLAPDAGLDVKVKLNPGERLHAECGVDGYRSIKPAFARPLPAALPGTEHTLHAEITSRILDVWVDGVIVWEGDLGASAGDMTGPVGFRTDNTAVDLELRAPPGTAASCTDVVGD